MIKINLGEGKDPNSPTKISAARIGAFAVKLVSTAVLCYGANMVYEQLTQMQVNSINQTVQQMIQQKQKYDAEISKAKPVSTFDTEYDQNEPKLRSKLIALQELLSAPDSTGAKLIALAQSMPKDVWLTEFQEMDQGIIIRGGATDAGMVSDLMGRLGETPYFPDVTLKNNVADATGGKTLFELNARKN